MTTFAILLEFSCNRAQASAHMDGHNTWLRRGFDDGAFLLAGSLSPSRGGFVLARGDDADAMRRRVDQDPFVTHEVVSATVLEVDPKRAVPELGFLVG